MESKAWSLTDQCFDSAQHDNEESVAIDKIKKTNPWPVPRQAIFFVCSVRRYGKEPVRKFCEALGCRAVTSRWIPGSISNPLIGTYIKDAAVIVIVDPHADKGILQEARLARIPVVSLIDTDDTLSGIDLAVPANNRGKKALGLAFWILARSIMLELGKISSESEFPYTLEDFTSNIVPTYRGDNQNQQRSSQTY